MTLRGVIFLPINRAGATVWQHRVVQNKRRSMAGIQSL